MKVAICFSGSIRDFKTCYPSLKRYFLDNINGDIFLHLWKMEDMTTCDAKTTFKWRSDSCNEEYVINNLNPVSYVVDKYSDIWEKKIIDESNIDLKKLTDEKSRNYGINACGMYYKIHECFKLVEKYCVEKRIKYDLIIRARLDFIWEDYIYLSNFNNINDNTIFLIKDRYATHAKLATNDKYFAGSYGVMKKMCNLFNHIKYYQDMCFQIEGQTLLENHIKMLNLKVHWIGHEHTYYKCMGRHVITNNKKFIIFDNTAKMENLYFELAYFLLYHNYNVIYLNNSPKEQLLKVFPNFCIDKNFPILKAQHFIHETYKKEIKIRQLIINIFNNLPEPRHSALKNCVKIVATNNISIEELSDFIISIIFTNTKNQIYHFKNGFILTNIDIGEQILFKYIDRGWYKGTIVCHYDKNNTYDITFDKFKVNTMRSYFKVINLPKYVDGSNELIPTNCHKRKHYIN